MSGYSATFSIAARDEATGMLGVAVASKVLAVGASCPFVQAGVGAIASQAYLNPALGVRGLALLAEGLNAEETLAALLAADEGRDWRQLHIVDSRGGSSAFSGRQIDPWNGSRHGPNYALGGNLLVDEAVVADMERCFLAERDRPFGDRLLRVLEAADAAGGDRRGKQSAALYVAHRQPVPYIDLRVDDHAAPIQELRRLYEMADESGWLAFRAGVAETLQPRSLAETIDRQRLVRQKLGIPID